MTWSDTKRAVQDDLRSRGLQQPQRRLSALDGLERIILSLYPDTVANPSLLLIVGKEALTDEIAARKSTGKLNGAEKSVLNDIFRELTSTGDRPSQLPSRQDNERAGKSSSANVSPDAKTGLPPIVWDDSRILILGTLPGETSLQLQQYYANPRNQFWLILSHVYAAAVPATYPEKLAFLRRHKLALWDVAHSAQRPGSLDSAIKHEIPNDIRALTRDHPNLSVAVFNGTKAETLYHRHIESKRTSQSLFKHMILLPSTSPMRGKNVLSLEAKIERWHVLVGMAD